MHHAIIAAVLGALAAATVIAFIARGASPRLSRGLAHPVVTAFGITLGVVTVLVGLRLDVGPWFETFVAAVIPSTALRVVLTITGSLAVVLVVASAALRRDQRQKRSTAP